ncbi:MAG: SpoIIE family protein phosphatase [bacterium]|nr:SpoIIE family protein phosphatase [bacterium]
MTGEALELVGVVEGEEIRQGLAEGTLRVGRGADVDLRLVAAGVSRSHAEIVVSGDRVTVADLESRNGTRLNGSRVTEAVPVSAGDTLEFAGCVFRIEVPGRSGGTRYNESATLMPKEEISWEEVREQRAAKRDRQSLLFQVLAEAGDLLTVQRSPEELYEPILDLVQTALDPERIIVLLVEEGAEEPQIAASRTLGRRRGEGLALSRTMVNRVLNQKTSLLTTDPLNDPDLDGAMSMISQQIRTAVAAPLFDNEDVIGLLYADDSRPGKRISRDELRAFTLLANGIAVAITHARYHALEEEKRRQDAELATASDILENILPTAMPDVPGYDLIAHLEPCFEVGGDLYEARFLPDGRLAFCVGDVSGKGLGAALLVTQILSLSRFMVGEGWEAAPLVTRLNREIFQTTDHLRFATSYWGYLEPETGHVTCVNAGHNQPFLVRADGRCEICPIGGLPVGILEDSEYAPNGIDLDHGDTLVLFSDGIPEAVDEADEEYGEDRLAALLTSHRDRSLAEMVEAVRADLEVFRGDAPVGDDVTLVLLKRLP